MKSIKSRKHTRTPQLLAFAATALPFAAQAADQVVELPTIVVSTEQDAGYKVDQLSSAKFTQPLVDTTQTVSIIGKEILQQQSATTLTEALRNVAGVGTFAVGENGRMNTGDAISMRGFDVANSIFVDNVRDLGNVSRDVFNIEQIEVFKGAAGTDNGRTSASGSINLKSKVAQAQDFARASLGGGSDNFARATVDLNKTVNEGAAIRLNSMAENTDGIGRDGVENKKWAIAPSIGLGLDNDTRAYFNYLYTEQDNVIEGGVHTVGIHGFDAGKLVDADNAPLFSPEAQAYFNSHPVDPSTFYGSNSDYDDVEAQMATVRVEHDLSETSNLTSTVRWGRTTHKYLSTVPHAISLEDGAAPQDAKVRRIANYNDSVNKIITSQTNFVTAFQTGAVQHQLSTGLEVTRESMDNKYYDTPRLETSLYRPDPTIETQLTATTAYTSGEMDTYSIYAFDTLKLSPMWSVNGGVRLDHYQLNTHKVENTAGGGEPATYEFSKKSDDDNLFNWKAGVQFKPAKNGSIYASYSVQQQPPGTIAGFDGATNSNAFDTDFTEPQKTNNVELGTKWELFDHQLLLSGAIFQTKLRNEATAEGGITYQNGKKTVEGVELSAVGQITDQWQLSTGYTHQETDIDNVESSAGVRGATSADGSANIPFTPGDAFTLWSTYKADKWSVGGGTRYIGEMNRSNSGGNPAGPKTIEDAWIVDAMANYQLTRNIGLQFNINNIFDEQYIVGMNRGGWRYIPGAERSYRATLNFNF